MNGLLEHKSRFGDVKDIDTKKRIVTGYLSDFDTKDYDGDIIVKGAYKKTLSEIKQYFLNQHNWAQPHGFFQVLEEDNKGLYFESEPLIDTTYSSDLMKLYEAGIIKEHSIGFTTVKSSKDASTGARILKEIKLYEGSNVTRGANPNTPFTGMKNLTMKEINDQTKQIVKALHSGTFTDDTFILLEIALKQLQLDAYNLGKKSLDNKEPLNTNTPEIIVEPNIEEYKSILTNFNNTL